jgi:uncharacterized protein (DUF1778 family)
MATKLKTVSVRLDRQAGMYIDRAAKLLHQSQGAFLARVGEEAAEQVLLKWAVEQYRAGTTSLSELAEQYRAGTTSLSELAEQTDIPLEAIAQQVAESRAQEATEIYLAGCHKLAQNLNLPQFYTTAKKAVQHATSEHIRR